jgi:hypothetical protein
MNNTCAKHELFISAIHGTNQLELTFNSKEKGFITRTCAPLDFGPWRRSSEENDVRYHLYDLSSSSGKHPLSIKAEQIIAMELIEQKFLPEYIVQWKPNWHIARDWGIYS